MQFILKLASAALLLTSFASDAQQAFNESISAAPAGKVTIEHVLGQATIRGWDEDKVQISGTLGSRTKDVTFERDGDTIVFTVKVKDGSWGDWGSEQDDALDIFVPKKSRLHYRSVNANVSLAELGGELSVETVNGAIDGAKINGEARINTVNGNIRLDAIHAELEVESVNGAITLQHTSNDDLELTSVNGDIDAQTQSHDIRMNVVNGDGKVTATDVHKLRLESVNGDMALDLSLASNAKIEASSVGGDLDFRFKDEVSAHFDINAHAGGDIVNALSDDRVQKAKYGPARRLAFTLEGGDSRVEVTTVNGDIRLGKGK